MGSGDWFKNIINKKKTKARSQKSKLSVSEKSNASKVDESSRNESAKFANCLSLRNQKQLNVPTEDVAATRIQTVFRAFVARKAFRRLKGVVRLQDLIKADSVTKQASVTLGYLHSWSKIQAEIKGRRLHMVTEGRLRQKKLENQLKLEARLHDVEVEWSGGSETMDEVLARINQREEAAVKRERAMAYAFSHQWRASSNANSRWTNGELAQTNWAWSWTDHWVAAQPWESRLPVQSSPKKPLNRQLSKNGKSPKTPAPTMKKLVSMKSKSPSGKSSAKGAGKTVPQKAVEDEGEKQ